MRRFVLQIMGATQSKKRRKDKQKKRSESISVDMPRSVSMDDMQPSSGIASCPSACPLCPHCRSSVSWSSDHSLTHSLCLYHARQGRDESMNKTGHESCPDCFLPPPTQGCLRLCEISNHDYDDKVSTMSLNRHLSGKSASTPSGGIVQSKSAEFTDLVRKVQYDQTKENYNPELSHYANQHTARRTATITESSSRASFSTTSTSTTTTTTNRRLRSLDTSSPNRQNTDIAVRASSSFSQSTSSPSQRRLSTSSSFRHRSKDQEKDCKERTSSVSLLEDDDTVESRWIKRKRMAQELRNLRVHIQKEEVTGQASTSPPHFVNFKLPPSANNNKEDYDSTELKASDTNHVVSASSSSTSHCSTPSAAKDSFRTHANKDSVCSSSTSTTNTTAVTTTISASTSTTRRSGRSKFSRLSNYRYLDNHPVMTRLQNEQNNRLELMERRMEEIRINAMREAERRKFAEIFPAKDDDSQTQKLLREARESLERMKEEKRNKISPSSKGQQYYQSEQNHTRLANSDSMRLEDRTTSMRERNADSRSDDDSGEIIPVRVMSSRETTPPSDNDDQVPVTRPGRKVDQKHLRQKSIWLSKDWPDINLGKPLTWLWLPFMLFPLVLRMLMVMIINSLPSAVSPRNSNTVNNSHDRNQNISRHKRKKSC